MKVLLGFFSLLVGALGLSAVASDVEFNAGADLRIRQELMKNVPGLPGGGYLSRSAAGPFRNHVRFRPRVWMELKALENWRVYTRLADEFRWNPQPHNDATTFPDELIVDNLYLEGSGLLDGWVDFSIGRQDLYNYRGLDHIFVDGTPGDGSRSVYSDMVKLVLKPADEMRLDLFFLHNADDNPLRWGTTRSKHRSLSGIAPGAEAEMDDWGWGGIWSAKLADWLPYQVFAMQKVTEAFWRNGERHPWTRRELLGFKVMPQLTEEVSLQLEGMGQIGRNGDGAWLSGWSAYAGANWKRARGSIRPFGKVGIHLMSGDENAAAEDGGHHAWDPMWSRGANDAETFLYGTHYGVGWWSNMMFLKVTGGIDFSKRHQVTLSSGPMFASANDGLGGGDGAFKGLLSVARYEFPIWLADASKGERLEIFGHLHAELFNPGDYFATDKPAWFVRWQLDFRF